MPYENRFRIGGDLQERSSIGHPSFAAEANHRVANSFSLLAGLVSNQAREVARRQNAMAAEEVSHLLKEIGSRIAAVGQLHRAMSDRPEAGQLDLNEHLLDLCDGLIEALARPGQFELLQSAAGPCEIDGDRILPVCLIVTEIVTNTLKYSHPTGVGGRVMVGCWRDADGSVLVEVADDGVGFPDGFDPAADGGLGTRTVLALSRQLGAQAEFASEPIGLRFRLRLPAARSTG